MSRSPRSVRITLGDVAKRAGVSLTTVSLVLGNKAEKHRISQEVLERVRKAAAELDYGPNRLVHSMQRGYTHILSLFDGFRNRVAGDLYMDTLSSAIERVAGKHGYDILVNCNYARTPEETYWHLKGGIVDGVLFFAPAVNDPLLPFLRGSRLPSVLINGRDEAGSLSSVRDDVASGMRQVAQSLVSLGHRQVMALTEPDFPNADQKERIAILRAFLQEEGAQMEEAVGGRHPLEDVHLAVKLVRDDPRGFTAIFCWRDNLAYKVLEACETLGIRVPEQLSVIGYDGLPWPAATRHTVASVHVDLDLLAQEAVGLLAQDIRQDPSEPTQRLLPVTLKPGTTLASPQRKNA